MSPIDTSAPLDTTVPSASHPATSRPAASPLRGATPAAVDLAAPIWTIAHVAAGLHLSVDRAREYTSSPAFPAPRAGFGRHLWLRQQVLDWFEGLPAGQSHSTAAARSRTRRPAQPRRSTYARRSAQ
jgi:hypothetical protein